MKKTKKKTIGKVISALLAVSMIFGTTSITAFAAMVDSQGDAVVYYQAGNLTDDNGTPDDPTDDTVDGTYLVSIPAFIKAADVDGTPKEYNVTAKEVLIPFGTSLKISVDFENNLKLDDNNAVTLNYDMLSKPSTGSLATINSGATILTVPAGNPDAVTTSKIAAVLSDAPAYSGTYTNTATFNIGVR